MTDRRIDLGPTGETVRANVTYLREDQNLTYAELSRRLEDVGNPIPPLGLRRIEAGERRVHVDDLMALSVVLQTSPTALLMPNTPDAHDEVTATSLGGKPAHVLWKWIRDGTTSENRTLHLPLYGGPQWWMEEKGPVTAGESSHYDAFLQALKKAGINISFDKMQSNGDD